MMKHAEIQAKTEIESVLDKVRDKIQYACLCQFQLKSWQIKFVSKINRVRTCATTYFTCETFLF